MTHNKFELWGDLLEPINSFLTQIRNPFLDNTKCSSVEFDREFHNKKISSSRTKKVLMKIATISECVKNLKGDDMLPGESELDDDEEIDEVEYLEDTFKPNEKEEIGTGDIDRKTPPNDKSFTTIKEQPVY